MSTQVWPAERFYWAVLDAPGLRAGVLPAGLMLTLQEEVPAAVESLHPVMTPLEDGRMLVCAAPCELLATLAQGTLSLRAERVPAFTSVPQGVTAPELLAGQYEPRELRRERTRRWLTAAAAIVLSATLISAGLVHRAHALEDHATAAGDRLTTLMGLAGVASSPEALPDEIARLREVRAAKLPLPASDASENMTALLGAWPTSIECEAHTISITATSITLALSVTGDARPLLNALKPPPGWVLNEPRLSTNAGATRINLTFRRASGGGT